MYVVKLAFSSILQNCKEIVIVFNATFLVNRPQKDNFHPNPRNKTQKTIEGVQQLDFP